MPLTLFILLLDEKRSHMTFFGCVYSHTGMYEKKKILWFCEIDFKKEQCLKSDTYYKSCWRAFRCSENYRVEWNYAKN